MHAYTLRAAGFREMARRPSTLSPAARPRVKLFLTWRPRPANDDAAARRMASRMGQRLLTTPGDRRAATASSADLSLLPIYIVEDVIRQRLRAQITHNWLSIGWFLATRTPLMCAAVHLAKVAVKRHVLRPRKRRGRWRRLARAAAFVLDELLPTGFYGMLLTYGLLARRMVRELEDN